MKSWLFRNSGLKIFSLIIASFIWLYFFTVREGISPFKEAVISFAVPVNVVQQQSSMLVVTIKPGDTRLTLKGRGIKGLKAKDVLAFVRVDDLKGGTHTLPVHIDTPHGIEVISKNPDKVKVTLEPLRKKRRRR